MIVESKKLQSKFASKQAVWRLISMSTFLTKEEIPEEGG